MHFKQFLRKVEGLSYKYYGTSDSMPYVGEDIKKPSNEWNESTYDEKWRKRSHIIVFFSLFLQVMSYSIVLTGIYPYLKILENNPKLSKTYIGWVAAMSSIGQTIFSPVFGCITNKLGSIRYLMYFSCICLFTGNLLYGLLPYTLGIWDDSAYHFMLISRLIIGISGSSTTICRSYIATSTTVEERTKIVAYSAVALSMGYIVGPVVQLIVNLIISREDWQYQSAGIIPAVLVIFNFIILLPFSFKEYDLSASQRDQLKSDTSGDIPKPDKQGMICLCVGCFIIHFNYLGLMVLMEPFVQDQYGWCDEMAVVIVGGIVFANGIIQIIMFVISAKLSKLVDERKLLLWFSYGISIIGLVLLLPWGPNQLTYCEEEQVDHHVMSDYSRNNSVFEQFCGNVTECLGCPHQQEWCKYTPQLPFAQLVASFVLIICSFPFGLTMSTSILSKMLGPRPQGTWMGIYTSMGGFSRALCPIFVAYVYTGIGTRYMAAIMIFSSLISLMWLRYLYSRIVPLKM